MCSIFFVCVSEWWKWWCVEIDTKHAIFLSLILYFAIYIFFFFCIIINAFVLLMFRNNDPTLTRIRLMTRMRAHPFPKLTFVIAIILCARERNEPVSIIQFH